MPVLWAKNSGAVQEDTSSADAGDDRQFPVQVHLNSGASYGCDLVVSATGVMPDTSWLPECLERDKEGSLLVDRWALHPEPSWVNSLVSLTACLRRYSFATRHSGLAEAHVLTKCQ